ncbi:MAG: hypothetical protein JW712_04275 [Dehalococcoidales bacterium]|nr:hypothetical protein [Dehalococcoidales bacterium]
MAEPKESEIFVNPDKLPTMKEVIREFQRIRGVNIRVNPEIAQKVLDITESGNRAIARFTRTTPAPERGWEVCILCDASDVCDPCDYDDYNCNGADACVFHDMCMHGD